MTRGEIWWADFGIPFESEPGFYRPVLIMQIDALNISNIHTILALPLASNLLLENAPGNVFIGKNESGLQKDSVVVVSQLSVLDKTRLIAYEKKIANRLLEEIDNGIKLVLGLK